MGGVEEAIRLRVVISERKVVIVLNDTHPRACAGPSQHPTDPADARNGTHGVSAGGEPPRQQGLVCQAADQLFAAMRSARGDERRFRATMSLRIPADL